MKNLTLKNLHFRAFGSVESTNDKRPLSLLQRSFQFYGGGGISNFYGKGDLPKKLPPGEARSQNVKMIQCSGQGLLGANFKGCELY